MTVTALVAKKTTLKKGGTTIAGIVSLNGPGLANPSIDVTTLADTWRQFIASIPDGGEVTFSLSFLPADTTQKLLINAMTAATAEAYTIEFPDTATTTWTVNALVTAFQPTAPEAGDKLGADVTLKVSGPVLY